MKVYLKYRINKFDTFFMSKRFSIIVAGGSGSRMNNLTPKQFLLLDNKPILIHTLEKFLAIKNNKILLILPLEYIQFWEDIKMKYGKKIADIQVIAGGKTRFQSVKNGLNAINEEIGLVAIHDAVRPLIEVEKINEAFELSKIKPAVVLAVDAKDSVRIVTEENVNKAIDRKSVKLIQTPQVFNLRFLKKAYLQQELDWFTDDASVIENDGVMITLLEGHYSNIKITTPEDLILAKILLKESPETKS